MNRLVVLGLFLIGSAAGGDHPHLLKTVTANLPGPVEVSVRYQTASAGEVDPDSSPAGTFMNLWAPMLTLSEDVRSGATEIPSGRYTLGLIKKNSGDWTLALHPGRLGQKEALVTPKMIILDTLFSRSSGRSDHLSIDFDLGTGQFEGDVVLTFHLGTLFLVVPLE
jgi:hypothetical protein